jgi:hypothetical protein
MLYEKYEKMVGKKRKSNTLSLFSDLSDVVKKKICPLKVSFFSDSISSD